jgi:hypothetical protein
MSRTVLQSLENFEHDRCVDLFQRENGTFGFDSWRRDPEANGGWFVIGGFADEIFDDPEQALQSARRRIPWFHDLMAVER